MGLNWDPFLDALAAVVHGVRTRASGHVAGPAGCDQADRQPLDLVLSYYEVFDELGLESPAVVGHSFGGMVAAEVAATNPSRVSRLALIDPVGLWRDDSPVKNWMADGAAGPRSPAVRRPHGAGGADDGNAAARPGDGPPDGAAHDVVAGMHGQVRVAHPGQGTEEAAAPDHSAHAHPLGEQDGLVPPVYASDFEAAIANARIELIAGAGHIPQMEQLERTANAVATFLQE